jgi:hypothetical protein
MPTSFSPLLLALLNYFSGTNITRNYISLTFIANSLDTITPRRLLKQMRRTTENPQKFKAIKNPVAHVILRKKMSFGYKIFILQALPRANICLKDQIFVF